jgi:hypothetical protein
VSDRQYVVIVGTNADEDTPEKDAAGQAVHGVFTWDEAAEFQRDVEDVWSKQDPKTFIYGAPYASIERVLADDQPHPFYSRAARAAANWYNDEEQA